MHKCWQCQTKVPLWRHFFVNFDNKKYLECQSCHVELIVQGSMLLHYLITGIIFALLIIFDDYLPENEWLRFGLTMMATLGYFYLFLPFKKRQSY